MDQEPEDTASQPKALKERIRVALRSSLEDEWNEVLGQWSGAAPEEQTAVRAYASELRDRILGNLLKISTLDELERALAIQYVEVKCHWLMLNAQIQHQTAQEGRPEERLIYRATCVSLILQALDPLVNRQSVNQLADLLVESFE